MAMGRASGDNRVERAIVDALDSPLLCGNDVDKAKKILFNIYASSEHPILVSEMREIDDFFDQLDPDIEVIWGTSNDDTLGEDAKVTILATGIENDFTQEANGLKDDSYYEEMISKLYKPMKLKKSEENGMKAEEEEKVELPFEVDVAPEPEPAVVEKPIVAESGGNSAGKPTSVLGKWKKWLRDNMEMYEE